jgi:hypothetical protein
MTSSRALLTLAAATILAAFGAPDPAVADSTPAADFALTLSSQRPSTATGLTLHIVFKNPSDPNAMPLPQRRVVIQGPAGTRIDGIAVTACHASDAELMLEGASACPSASHVGDGTLTLRTNGGPLLDPFVDDVTLFNGGDQLLELFTKQGTPIHTAVGHRSFAGPNTLAEDTPAQPGGPPSFESSVRQIDYRIDRVTGTTGRAFVTTPPSCPADRTWRSTLTFTTADGHTYTVSAGTPCQPARTAERHRRGAARPRRRATRTRRHVRRGHARRAPRFTG